jgi:HNH endonuclease
MVMNQIDEIRDCPGCPGYEISIVGDVYSRWRRYGRRKHIIDQSRHRLRTWNGRGYTYVSFGADGRRRTANVGVLVLEAFRSPRPPGLQCRHLDGDRANNRLENLAWGTPKENAADKRRHGTELKGNRKPNARLHETDVAEVHTLNCEGVSRSEIARAFGVSRQMISHILAGKKWRHVFSNPRQDTRS